MNCIKYKGKEYKTGDAIIFKIDNIIVRGKLYITPSSSKTWINAYVCHNNKKFDGSIASEKFGYTYSWSFTVDLRDRDPFDGSDVQIICPDIDVDDKENFKITKKLKLYLETQELELVAAFFERGTIFKQYNKIEMSEKTGYVKLTNTDKNRFVDIKFGRFLTSLFKEIKDVYGIEFGFVNKDVEKFYNCFVAYQTNTSTEILELKGDDILEAYKEENYLLVKSSLGGSCMSDKLDNIKLYTLNPNVVSLLVIKTFGKIVGRCFIWNTNQGKVMDKQYTCFDWVNSKFDTILKKNNYICQSTLEDYPNCKKIDIQLENIDVDKYPYIDTFRFLNRKKGFLTNAFNEDMEYKRTKEEYLDFIQLSRTTGDYIYFDERGREHYNEDEDENEFLEDEVLEVVE